jgi:putative membrane protein
MYWYGHDMFGWGNPLALIATAVFWAAVIYGIVALVRYAGRNRKHASGPAQASAAERLLAERFARGEIDEDEYRRRLATLRADLGGWRRGSPMPSGAKSTRR